VGRHCHACPRTAASAQPVYCSTWQGIPTLLAAERLGFAAPPHHEKFKVVPVSEAFLPDDV
jgi:hypothetical protein